MNTALLDNTEVYNELSSCIPVARWGTPEEVGKLAAYLCAAKSAFVTGTDVVIDGGWCAQ